MNDEEPTSLSAQLVSIAWMALFIGLIAYGVFRLVRMDDGANTLKNVSPPERTIAR